VGRPRVCGLLSARTVCPYTRSIVWSMLARSPNRGAAGALGGRSTGFYHTVYTYDFLITIDRACGSRVRGARSSSALSRTFSQNHVCHHPSLRASRQDRRRVHRQGHQRQVHDGLEAARQQVRIRRARRSTTTRARVESGGPGARMIIPRAGAGADRVGRERWVTPRARRRIREEYSSHVFVARAFVRARRRARARVVARVGGDLIATDARRAYLFGFSARRRRG